MLRPGDKSAGRLQPLVVRLAGAQATKIAGGTLRYQAFARCYSYAVYSES
jgi:hypothetical protein